MVKCKLNKGMILGIDEKNPKLVEIYKDSADEFFHRAEYLKVVELNKDKPHSPK